MLSVFELKICRVYTINRESCFIKALREHACSGRDVEAHAVLGSGDANRADEESEEHDVRE